MKCSILLYCGHKLSRINPFLSLLYASFPANRKDKIFIPISYAWRHQTQIRFRSYSICFCLKTPHIWKSTQQMTVKSEVVTTTHSPWWIYSDHHYYNLLKIICCEYAVIQCAEHPISPPPLRIWIFLCNIIRHTTVRHTTLGGHKLLKSKS